VFSLKSLIQSVEGREKPTTHQAPQASESGSHDALSAQNPVELDPHLKKLLEQAEKEDSNIQAWKVYASAIAEAGQKAEDPRMYILEAVEANKRILSIDPNDRQALLDLGDLCFDQKIFQKALEYYDRYLALEPNDDPVRAQRASTLTFIGKVDESIATLREITGRQPSSFKALAYLSIALAQKGEIAEAQHIGQKALEVSPNTEARARFGAFLGSLGQTGTQTGAQVPPTADWLAALQEKIKANPIAGSKFIRAEQTGTTIVLLFHDFPMEGMPDFAKNKFINSIQSQIPGNQARTMVFKDNESGREMLHIELSPK
jgi:tetratricopeptide (TPR) repeat protein